MVNVRLSLYVDDAYLMSQLASPCQKTFIVQIPVYNFQYRVITGLLHSVIDMTPCYSALRESGCYS